MNVHRWLLGQGQAFAAQSAPRPVAQPSGFAVALAGTNAQAAVAGADPADVLKQGVAYLFQGGRATHFVFVPAGKEAVPLSRVRARTPFAEGTTTPKSVLIQVSASENGRLRTIWAGEMAADGVLDTGPLSKPLVRRVVISVLSAWGSGPVALGGLSFE